MKFICVSSILNVGQQDSEVSLSLVLEIVVTAAVHQRLPIGYSLSIDHQTLKSSSTDI